MDWCTIEDKPTYQELLESAVVRSKLISKIQPLFHRVVRDTSLLRGALMSL